MKKLFIIGLFLIAILALGVSAADLTVSTTSLSVSEKPTRSFSTSFSVKNATANFTGLSLSQTGLDAFSINYSISGVPVSSFNLNMGEEKTIIVSGKIPKNVNTQSSPFSGSIVISGSGVSKAIDMKITAASQLDLESVKFIVDGKSKSISDGDTRKEVKPGSKLEIKGDIQNTFSDSDDITIEDVTVEITIKNIDDDEDLEGDDDVGDIDADDKESFSAEFEIPEDVDDGEYSVEILVEGEDENGAKHSVKWDDVKVGVEKDKDDIVITKLSVSPSKVSCSRNINLNVDLKNQGRSDEDEVVVRIENADLDIDQEDTSIPQIDEGTGEDTEYGKSYSFKIDDKVKEGTYPIMVKSYYNTDTLSDSKTVDLIVEKCAVETPAQEKPSEVVIVNPPKQQETETPAEEEEETPEVITETVAETTETSLFQSNTYLIFLIGAVGVAVIVIIIMIIVLFSVRRKNV